MKMEWIRPIDIAEKLWFRKQLWFHGPPAIRTEGEEGHIGKLVFNFHDVTVKIGVYLMDKREIEDRAALAVANFQKYIDEILEEDLYT